MMAMAIMLWSINRGLRMKYQVVFQQGYYSCVDYETDNYDQAVEVMYELQAQMYACGERNFSYFIKTVRS